MKNVLYLHCYSLLVPIIYGGSCFKLTFFFCFEKGESPLPGGQKRALEESWGSLRMLFWVLGLRLVCALGGCRKLIFIRKSENSLGGKGPLGWDQSLFMSYSFIWARRHLYLGPDLWELDQRLGRFNHLANMATMRNANIYTSAIVPEIS